MYLSVYYSAMPASFPTLTVTLSALDSGARGFGGGMISCRSSGAVLIDLQLHLAARSDACLEAGPQQ
jgi:hypothetical protein